MRLGLAEVESLPESRVKRRIAAQVLVRVLDPAQGIVQAPVLVQALVPGRAPVLRRLREAEQSPVQAVIERWSLPTRRGVGWTTKKIRNRLEMLRMFTGSERRVPRLKHTRSMPERPNRAPVDTILEVREAVQDLPASTRIQAVGIHPALMEALR